LFKHLFVSVFNTESERIDDEKEKDDTIFCDYVKTINYDLDIFLLLLTSLLLEDDIITFSICENIFFED